MLMLPTQTARVKKPGSQNIHNLRSYTIASVLYQEGTNKKLKKEKTEEISGF
jgi:hypothetical protein